MARSWSGFLPLNQEIKEQWQNLEDTQDGIDLGLARSNAAQDELSDLDDGEDFSLPIRGLRQI